MIKSDTLQTLNEAFSTPVDREDIYRAIIGIEDLANYLKATISEMQLFELSPNKYDLDIAMHLRDGIIFLRSGFLNYQRIRMLPNSFGNLGENRNTKLKTSIDKLC
ncbi:MAG: hypothetical protein IPP60_13415 [Sphingobacteriales bacterium]|nr:hypothetical protein [Sphingobacteriales bacterium]